MVSKRLQAAIIFNPAAGRASLRLQLNEVIDFWHHRGWQIEVQPTRYSGHGEILAREAAERDRQLVLVAGGDGTIGEIAGGLAGTDTVMGILPAGTGNSFAKELNMPRSGLIQKFDLIKACDSLASGCVNNVDIGRCGNGNRWLLWLGVGFDGYAVKRIEPRSRRFRKLGRLGYAASIAWVVPSFSGIKAVVNIDGREIAGEFIIIAVTNCRRYAGGQFLLNPSAVLDDGQFDVFFFEGTSPLDVLKHFFSLAISRGSKHQGIIQFSGRKVSIRTYPQSSSHLDGEPGSDTPIECEIEDKALRLLVPSTAPADLFVKKGEPFFG